MEEWKSRGLILRLFCISMTGLIPLNSVLLMQNNLDQHSEISGIELSSGAEMKLSDIISNEKEFERRIRECCARTTHEVDVNSGFKDSAEFEDYIYNKENAKVDWSSLLSAAESFE